MTAPDRPADRHAGDRAPAPLPEPDQGPEGDDPTIGLLEELDDVSVSDRDLVEPGLGEAELGLAEIDEARDVDAGPYDEVGMPGGDEATAAAEELDEAGGPVGGSEPLDVPGVTDDLFPPDDDDAPARDGGEEGIEEDLSAELDDSVSTGDRAWQEAGPSDDDDPLGGEFLFHVVPPVAAAVPPAVEPVAGLDDAALVAPAGPRLILALRPDVGGAVRLDLLLPPSARRPLGPPLVFDDEGQVVVSAAGVSLSGARDVPEVVHAATDRGMIFRWSPGEPGWSVADSYVGPSGATTSWLPLGIPRAPFRLLASAVFPRRVWAWRPGGPLLCSDAGAAWTTVEGSGGLRALAEDASAGRVLVFAADDEAAVLRRSDVRGEGDERPLPGGVGDVLLAPGATVAARDGVIWVACRDPEAPALRGEAGGVRWSEVSGLRGVRWLAPLPGGRRLWAVVTDPVDETDELLEVSVGEAPRRLLRAVDLGSGGSGAGAGRIDGLVIGAGSEPVAWLLHGGRVSAIRPAGAAGGRGS